MQFSAFFTANETTNKVDVRLKELTQEYGKNQLCFDLELDRTDIM